jgi:iron-sulfur cluster repair protein YtfE (RIC family)
MAGLTALGQVLHEEHFRILIWMCDLQNRVTGETGEQCPVMDNDQDKDELHDLINCLDQVMAHHAFEEDVVFPLLRAEGNIDIANLLTDEHVAIEPTAHFLRALTVDILRHGPGKGRWIEFRKVAQNLFSEMIYHLEKEEVIILQRLESLLDPETDHRLAVQHISTRLLPVVATNTTGLR